MNTEFSQIKLRLPSGLKKVLVARAKNNKRPVNAEVVDCIEKQLESKSIDSLEPLVSKIISNASNMANKESAINFLEKSEKDLLIKLDSIPVEKKKALLKILNN